MTLQHVNGKLHLAPAGAAFTPSDWQNAWHHIAITWNAEGQWVLYVDGMDYTGDDILRRPMTAAVALICGGAVPPTAPNGIIDDLMLFQIALASEQVQALFAGNLLKPGETPIPSAAVTNTSPAAATDLAPAATNSLPAAMPAATNSTAAPESTPAP